MACTYDKISIRNALDILLSRHTHDGCFGWAGPPISFRPWSDTYHMHTLTIVHDYYFFSGDIEWVRKHWDVFRLGMKYIVAKFKDGLLHVTGEMDWGRPGQGGINTSANAIMYNTLLSGARLAKVLNDPVAQEWLAIAARLKETFQASTLWDEKAGLFKDNPSGHHRIPETDLYEGGNIANPFAPLRPQDGNANAIRHGLATKQQSLLASANLETKWNDLGAVNPECGGAISPFITGFELDAHFRIGQYDRALELIRRQWGYMLRHPHSTGCTMLEAFHLDGELKYLFYEGKHSYLSHAHPWSTGPLYLLTYYVLGLRPKPFVPGGKEWLFVPMMGDLEFAEGGFVTEYGKIQGSWRREDSRVILKVSAPEGTYGTVGIPITGAKVESVVINGKRVTPLHKEISGLGCAVVEASTGMLVVQFNLAVTP
jgi:hypothetical protein